MQYVIGDTAAISVVDRAALSAYARLLLTDHDLDVIGRERGEHGMALADMLEDAILGFFRKARMSWRPKPAASSAPDAPSPTSGA
jgi:hypothetical protein